MSVDAAAMLAVRARLARLHEARLVVVAGEDPGVERHRRELFGDVPEPVAPGGYPAEEPHRLLLEWIGQPSPKDSPLIAALRAKGLLFAEERADLERMAIRAIRRVEGTTSRSLGTRDGLAETYRWGPTRGSYVRSVAFADAEKILAMFETGAEFRIVGNHASRQTTDDGRREHEPLSSVDPRPSSLHGPATRGDDAWRALVNAWRARRGQPPLPPDPLAIRYGPEEGLWKLSGPTMGLWQPFRR